MKLKKDEPEFWLGLQPIVRKAGQISLLFAIVSFIGALFFTYNYFFGNIKFPGVIFGCLGISGFFVLMTFMFIGRRVLNYFQGHGWKCTCGTKIGFGDISEAFRLKGVLGNLTEASTAYISCDFCGKETLIEWNLAYPILVEELENFISISEIKRDKLSNSKDSGSKLLASTEEQFIRKSKLLLEKGNPGNFLTKSFRELHSYLVGISGEPWNFDDREILYETLASIEAYWQIFNKHNAQGINPLSEIYKNKQLMISVEEIDSFSRISNVSPDKVADVVHKGYLKIPETTIKHFFEDILKEPLRKKDSPDEYNDIFTTNLWIEKKRTHAAMMLKGPGTTKGVLHIKDCGKNGDQLVRLFESPGKIFIIQAVGNISEQVVKDVESKVRDHRHQGKDSLYCLINGQDTARILRAYEKI